MKSLRYIVLLSLVVLLLASCAGLPPVFPSRAASQPGRRATGGSRRTCSHRAGACSAGAGRQRGRES